VDQRVVCEPGQDLRERRHGRLRRSVSAAQVEWSRHLRPIAIGRCGVVRGTRDDIGNGEARRRADELPGDPERERSRRGGSEHEEGLPARTAVREQQLVASNLVEGGPGRRIEAESAVGEAATEIGVGEQTNRHALSVARDLRRDGFRSIVAIHREMIRDQESPRRSLEHVDGQPQLVAVRRRPAADLEKPPRIAVDPARTARRHLERRRSVEQPVSVVELDEDALPVRPEQPEVAVRGREQAIDAHVALRDHRVEHSAHPHRRGERRLVRGQRLAGAQDLTVAAQARALLRRQDDVRIRAAEERQRAVSRAFELAPLRPELARELRGIELLRVEQTGRGEERWGGRRGLVHGARGDRRLGLGQRERALDEAEIALRARRRVIELEPAEEPARSVSSGCERDGLVLDHRQRVFVLESFARQLRRRGSGGGTGRARSEVVVRECVGGEVRAAPEGSDHRPGMAASDRQILSDRQHASARRMGERRVVDVLARVVLVQPDGAVVGERDVLDAQ
jgi:hypothetical protein